ncbi:hypothetical protein CS022_24015 [Veronia nyctiphanis]|uniref:Uncharacterized protein n=1 Tax=Veronia nyctiphanis TaxID=1278244 RepID=A0A4Q0YE86_9GAMM|nr:hypothetical protein [Veronia nyctiphanis]RXJ68806.1 hypothetical protein CS022_24015 [Veronia nyctiphanis]
MYFWRINTLKEDFIAGNVTEKSMFKYLVAYTIFVGLAMIPPSEPNQFDLLSILILIPVSIIGLLYAYSSNGGDSGTDFLAKYFAIGWVVTVRLLVVFIPLAVVTNIVMVGSGFDISEGTTMWNVLITIVIEAFYFWRIAVHIGQTANVNA